MYLDEVKDEDQRISDAWKEDSNGILVFVSPNLLIPFVRLNDTFQRLVFSPQLLVPLSLNSTKRCPPITATRQ